MAAEWVWKASEERWEGKGLWKCHGCSRSFPASVRPLMRMYAEGLGWCLCPHCGEEPPWPNQWDMTFDQLAAKNLEETGTYTVSVSSPATLTPEEENAYAREKQQEEDQGQWHNLTFASDSQWYINGEPLP